MCWCESVTSVTVLLLTMFVSSATGSGIQECNIHEPFTSPNIDVFYEEEVPLSGCQSSQTFATSKEVHVINLLSAPESLQPGQRVNVSLNVQQQRTLSQMRGTLLVFVLNCAIPVTWVLSTDLRRPLPIFNYRIVNPNFQSLLELEMNSRHTFPGSSSYNVAKKPTGNGSWTLCQIPQNTSVIKAEDLTVDLVQDANLPQDNSDLLLWVMDRYRAVTTLSAVEGANTINIKIGDDYAVPNPSTCEIQDNFEATNVEAYYIQDTPLRGCDVDQTSKTSDIRQVHVIELHSPSNEPIGTRPPLVVVDLKPSVRGREHLFNVVLVLKAHIAVTWNVRSEQVSGKLEILSPNIVQTGSLKFHSISQQADTTGIPETGADLVAWVISEYGAVESYTEAQLANHFILTVKESTNTDGLPQGPKTISSQQALGGPVLARIANVECRRENIRITIPKNIIIDYFGLAQENIILADPSCEAETVGSNLVLEMELDQCGTKKIVEEDKIIFENEVIFSDSDYVDGDGEGSGSSTTNSNLGDSHSDDDNRPIERFPIRCEYLKNGEPITEPPPPADQVENDIGNMNNHVTLYMELYRTTTFLRKIQSFPRMAPKGERLFFETGLKGSDMLTIVPNHCWIAPGGPSLPVILHELIVNSCRVDQTLVFHNTDNFIKSDMRSLRRFSFQVPTLESDMLDFYVHCELGLCSKDGSGVENGIPLCSNLLIPMASSCLADSTKLIQGPLQRLNIGPLQTKRGSNIVQEDEGIKTEYTGNKIIIQGLSAGPAVAVAFTAFIMGVVLTACLWYIHAHTGPRTEPPASPQTVSTPSSPSGNGHILNGHMPNGFLMNGAVGNGYVPNGGVNPNRIPPQGMMHGDPNAEEMV